MEKKKNKNNKKRPLINELTQGKELVNQLKSHLDEDRPLEACEFLVEKIVSSYEKALNMLNWSAAFVHHGQTPFPLESPPNSFGETSTPTSDNSDLDSKHQCKKNVFKKRKTMPKWSELVKVSSGTMADGPIGDGYSWRKYGQKDILGANFPRAYYRCTHQNAQGCLATKQVQKSDQDPSTVKVTYRGRHTCIQAAHLTPAALPLVEENKVQNLNKQHGILESHKQDMHFKLGTCHKSKEIVTRVEKELFPSFSFSFPSTPIETKIMEENFFLEAINIEDNFEGSYSPSFIQAQNVQSSNSDLTDIISAPTSVTNSPMADFDFQLDQLDFDPNFSLDNILESEFFC